ncbi:RNA polymerase sigma factor [Deferrisoma camini]|uniref:RNA polymerase sigma factor n=1 Tax=Deferrisoma camini TaxID=1035120 RepID=UPI00046CFE6E|nr:RNA polymerase sigma factor [Deferrisoma camini]
MDSHGYFDTDSELAVRALNGDRDAFGSLIEKYQGPIYRFALHFFQDPSRAEDVTQDTFLRAYRFLHTYDPSRRFATWLFTIARNQCIDRHRDKVRRDEVDSDSVSPLALLAHRPQTDPLDQLLRREDWSRLMRTLRDLPEKYKTPLVLCYLEGLPYQEIADIVGISLNNVKIRIFRAKKMILRRLGLLDGEGP